jgi:hypothetical protein
MRALSIGWPKLAGGIVGITAAGLILWQLGEWWNRFEQWRYGPWPVHIQFAEWLSLLVTVALLFLAYFLYRARDWARRAVIIAGICLGGFTLCDRAVNAVQAESRIYEGTPKTLEMRIGQTCGILREVGLPFVFLAPYAFFLCALCHRDVAATFHRGNTERSNQAMQRTAPRSDA